MDSSQRTPRMLYRLWYLCRACNETFSVLSTVPPDVSPREHWHQCDENIHYKYRENHPCWTRAGLADLVSLEVEPVNPPAEEPEPPMTGVERIAKELKRQIEEDGYKPKENDMKPFTENWNDKDGNPGGGVASGRGFAISWQNGPLGSDIEGADDLEPNGAQVEDVIEALIERLRFFQDSKFHCTENMEAIEGLLAAKVALYKRTSERKKRGVEGKYEA